MDLTEIKNEQRKLKAKLKSLEVAEKKAKEKSDPKRRLTKTEVNNLKVMLQAGEEIKIIAKKSSTNIEVVRYWQDVLGINEESSYHKDMCDNLGIVPKSKPIRNFSDSDKALAKQKRNHDPTYKHYSLKEKGKKKHDLMRKCPACFPESTMSLSEYNEFIRAGNFEAVKYKMSLNNKKSNTINKSMIATDELKIRNQTIKNNNHDIQDIIIIEKEDAITPEQTVAERTWHPIVSRNKTIEAPKPVDPPHTKLNNRNSKQNGKNSKRERKVIKQMGNIPEEVIIQFCKERGISL